MTMREPKSKTPFGIQSLTSRNAILSHFTIPKSYFINYTIPFYNTPNIPKFYFFPILFKYSIFFNISLSLSLSLSFPFRLSPSTSGTRTDKKKKKKKKPNKVSLGLKHHHHCNSHGKTTP